MKKLHPKIEALKLIDRPINFRSVATSQYDTPETFTELLDKRIVEGYGVIWGEKNEYGEVVIRGAYDKSIREMGPGSNNTYQIKLRDEHGRGCALMDKLISDDIGLFFRTVPLDNVSWCDDLLVQLRSGTVNNFSVGFKRVWEMMEYDDTQDAIIIKEARLFEVSACAVPVDLGTFVKRSVEEEELLHEEVEYFIKTLPRAKQLESRKLFTRCMTQIEQEPLEQRQQALKDNVPSKKGIDINYLLSKL